ncbi:MAG TPA: PD-(D/E)XK nuclease family protein [Blastocatellia bacterium]
MAEFEVLASTDAKPVAETLSPLRERLFNACKGPLVDIRPHQPAERDSHGGPPTQGRHEDFACDQQTQPTDAKSAMRLLECSDRQTEVRSIAKEIKRLVLTDGFKLGDIALIVRERASYEDTIGRVFEEEGIPCTLVRRTSAVEIPAVRAASRLIELAREEPSSPRVSDLADLIKSGYFRLSEDELVALSERSRNESPYFSTQHSAIWNADDLENAIAYVGGELRVDTFLARARQLTRPATETKREEMLEAELDDESEPEDAIAAAFDEAPVAERRRTERVEFVDFPIPGSERRPKFREVDPELVAWSALVVDRISRIIVAIPRKGSARELGDALMRLFDQLQFSAQVRSSEQAALSDRELPALALDLRGLESLRRAISAATRGIETTIGEASPTVELAAFLDEAVRCLKGESLVISRGDPDGLKVLEATEVRGLRFRAVFIAGLIEGGFPLRPSRDWIYPHEERERLKQYGLTLEDISPNTLLKEEHYFYQAACRATERLYLTRPLVLEDGSETVASYYIEELGRAIAPSEIKKEIVRSDFDGRELFDSSRESELAVSLVRQEERHLHRAQAAGNFQEGVVARLLAYARKREYLSVSARERISIERERSGLWFGGFDGVISNPSLVESFRDEYGAGHVFSASELSLYGKCPFKFFAEKILKLEPRGEAALDLTALDAGSLLHEALRRFFERHRGERLADLDRIELRRELGEVADKVLDEHERAVPPLNPRVWSIDREIRKLLLEQVLDYELTVQEKTRVVDVRPAYFELAFGMRSEHADSHSTEQRLEFHRGPGNQTETAGIRGQIDRVDIARDGTAIAYDYKLSKGATIDDLTDGRALQLHIYLAALERLFLPDSRIAGGGYYTIKGGSARRNKGLYRAAMKEYTGVRETTASTLSESEWQRIRNEMETRVWEFIDGIRAGRFVVDPSAPDQSCPHCDYSAVCRYEKSRIRGKERAS